jgi:hypothetical protein
VATVISDYICIVGMISITMCLLWKHAL